jgi:hypothetical protein
MEVSIDLVPLDLQVLMNQDVSEPGQGSQAQRKLWRKDTYLAQPQDRIIVINRLAGTLKGDDSVGDI